MLFLSLAKEVLPHSSIYHYFSHTPKCLRLHLFLSRYCLLSLLVESKINEIILGEQNEIKTLGPRCLFLFFKVKKEYLQLSAIHIFFHHWLKKYTDNV